jgi:hypothetical protein
MKITNETKNLSNSKENDLKTKSSLFTWFKFIVGLIFSGLIAYKLAISELSFDFSKFDFTSLLSLIMSIFAIGLSVAFYFKATDTSNLFYDNTYKFTKEISEILGRIEAGFGERLRHLDEGYSGLVNKFDNGHVEQNIKETKEEIEKEKQKLKAEIQERNNILNSVIEKAQLEQHEKEEIRRQLKEKEIEISKQNRELNFLRHRLHSEENEVEMEAYENLPDSAIRPLINLVKSTKDPEMFLKYPTSIIGRKFRIDLEELSKDELIPLLNMDIIKRDGTLTIHGIKILRQIAKRLIG